MDQYDWSHYDRVQRDLRWDEDQRRLDNLRGDIIDQGQATELGGYGKAVVYALSGLILAYFALVLLFGAH